MAIPPPPKPVPAPLPRRRRRLILRVLLWGFMGLVLLACAAPFLAGLLGKGLLARTLSTPERRVAIGSMSLGWLAGQRISHLTVTQGAGEHERVTADLSFRLDRGLLRLALGSRDLGTLSVDGVVDLRRGSEEAPAPPAPAASNGGGARGSSQIELPPTLALRVHVAGLTVHLPGDVSLEGVRGFADVGAGVPASLELAGQARTSGGTKEGFSVSATADGLVDASGRLAFLDPADWLRNTLSLTLKAKGLPASALGERGGAALGSALNADLRASFENGRGRVFFSAAAQSVSGASEFEIDQEGARLSAPATLDIKPQALAALLPAQQGTDPGTSNAPVTLRETPAARLVVESFSWPAWHRFDLRGIVLDSALTSSAAAGTILATPQGPPSALEIEPATLRVSTQGLGPDPLRFLIAARAKIDGRDAGSVEGNFSIAQFLDQQGRPRATLPGAIDGLLTLAALPTALAQPFAEPLGLDLPQDIGPTLDLSLKARRAPSGTTELGFQASGAALQAQGDFVLDATELRSAGAGTSVRLTSAGPLAGRFLARSLPPRGGRRAPSTAGTARLIVRDLVIGLSQTEGAEWTGRSKGQASLELLDMNVDPEIGPFDARLEAKYSPAVGLTAALQAQARGGRAGSPPWSVDGSALLPQLPIGGVPLLKAGLSGELTAKNIPADAWALRALDEPTARRFDELVRAAAGGALEATLVVKPGSENAAPWTLQARTPAVTAQAHGSLAQDRLELAGGTLAMTLSPRSVEQLLTIAEIEPASRPVARSPLALTATLGPARLARGGEEWKIAGEALTASLRLDNPVVIELPQRGAAGLAALTAEVSLKNAAPRAASLSFKADLTDDRGAPLAKAQGSATTGETPAGSVSLSEIDPAGLDRFAGLDGLLPEALGGAASARAEMTAAGELTLSLASPRLNVQPARARWAEGTLALAAPANAAWEISPAAASRLLGESGTGQPSLTLTAPARLTLNIDELTIAPGAAPRAKARGSLPSLAFSSASGTAWGLESITFSAQAGGPEHPRGAGANIAVGRTLAGDKPGPEGFALRATLDQLFDAQGKLTADAAALSAQGDIPALPTALLDALLGQGDLLQQSLGESVAVKVRAENLSKAGGTIALDCSSPTASLQLAGNAQDGVLVCPQPVRASLSRLSPGVTARLTRGLPLVGTLEKQQGDAPAVMSIANLRLPLSSDLAKLQADITLDLGEARLTPSRGFAEFLGPALRRPQSVIGQRLQPLNIAVRSGVATYQRWEIPLGEFPVQTAGSVDLVKRRLDVTTFVPVTALSEELSGKLRDAIGRAQKVVGADVVQLAGSLPFTTSGPWDSPTTKPDLEAYLKEIGKSIKPEDLIKKGLEKGLEELLKKKKK